MSQVDFFIELQALKNNKKHQQLLYFSNAIDFNKLKLYQIMSFTQQYQLSPSYAFELKRIAIESIKEGLQLNQQRYRLGFFNLADYAEVQSKITYTQLSLNSKYQVSHMVFSPSNQVMAFEAVFQGKSNREIHISQLDRIKGTSNFKEIPLTGISLDQDLSAISPKIISETQCLFLQEKPNNLWEIGSCCFFEVGHSADATKGRLNSSKIELITENAYACQLYEPYYQKSTQHIIWVGWHEKGGVAFFKCSALGQKQGRLQISTVFEELKNIIFDEFSERIYFIGKNGGDAGLFMMDLNFGKTEVKLRDQLNFENDFIGISGNIGEQLLFLLKQRQLDLIEFDSIDSTQMTTETDLDEFGQWEKILDVFELASMAQIDQIKLELEGKVVRIDSCFQPLIIKDKAGELYQFPILREYDIDEWHTQAQSKTMELGAISEEEKAFDESDESFLSIDLMSGMTDISEATNKYKKINSADINPQQVQSFESTEKIARPIFSQVNTLIDYQHPIDTALQVSDFDDIDHTQLEKSSSTQPQSQEQVPRIDTAQIQVIKQQILQTPDPLELMLTVHFSDWLQMAVASSDPLEELKKLQHYRTNANIRNAAYLLLKQLLASRNSEQSFFLIFMISAIYYLKDQQSIDLLFDEYQKQNQKNNHSLYESIEYYFILMLLLNVLNTEEIVFDPSKIFEEYQSTMEQMDLLFSKGHVNQAFILKKQVEDYQRELWQNIELIFHQNQPLQGLSTLSISQGNSPLLPPQNQKKEEHQADFISRIQQSSSSINLNLLFDDAQAISNSKAIPAHQINFQIEIDAQQQAQMEAQRQAQMEVQRQAQMEAQRQAQMEAQRQAQMEAQRQAQIEAQRQAQMEAQRQAQMEAQRQAQMEAQMEAQRQAQMEAQQQAQQVQWQAEQQVLYVQPQVQLHLEQPVLFHLPLIPLMDSRQMLEQELLNHFPYWLSLAMQSDDPIAQIKALEAFQGHTQIQENAVQHLQSLILSVGEQQQKSFALMFSLSACVFLDAESTIPLCYDWYKSVYLQNKPELYESIEYYFALNLLLYLLNISTRFDPSQIYEEFESALSQIEGLFEQGMVEHAISLKQALQKHQKELWLTIENKYQKSQPVQKIEVSLVNAVSPFRVPLKTEPFYSAQPFAQALQANSRQLSFKDLEEAESRVLPSKKPKTIAFQFNPFEEEEADEEAENIDHAEEEVAYYQQAEPYQQQVENPSFFQNSMSILQSSLSFYDQHDLQTPRFLKNFLLVQVLFALTHIFLSFYLSLGITILNIILLLSALSLYQGKSWAYYFSALSYFIYPIMMYSIINSRAFVKSPMRGPIWYILMLIAVILFFSLFNQKIKKFVFKEII